MIMNYNKEALKEKGTPFRLKINGIDFAFEKRLFKKIFLMCERILKYNKDAVLVNEGYEGDGKTNSSLVESIIAHSLIKEKFSSSSIHLFFKTSDCIEFAKVNKHKIIILDEPSFESLSTDSLNTLNKDFLRLVSTMRIKGHFFILNFTKFWKFPEFLIVDRALGMVRMETKNNKNPGKFLYIRQKNLEKLWNDKKKKNRRSYRKYYSFGGRMPFLMPEIFDNCNVTVNKKENATLDDYNEEKENSISTIGVKNTKQNIIQTKLEDLCFKVSQLPKRFNITQDEFARALGVNSRRLREWKNFKKPPIVAAR